MADPNVTAAFIQAVINRLREKGLLDDEDGQAINDEAQQILAMKREEAKREYEIFRDAQVKATNIVRPSIAKPPVALARRAGLP